MRNILAYTLLVISAVVLAPPGLAQETPEEPAVDPKAIAALNAMAAHRECGGVWYAPRYQGSQVVYVVVNQP